MNEWAPACARLELDTELAQLALVDRCRGARKWVDATGRLRERDHVADRAPAGHQGDPAIDAECDPAVGRCAVAKRLEQEAEALARLVLGDPQGVEHALL